MVFYAMTILQKTVLVCYRYKNSLYLILIISILYRTHFIATSVQASKTKLATIVDDRLDVPFTVLIH